MGQFRPAVLPCRFTTEGFVYEATHATLRATALRAAGPCHCPGAGQPGRHRTGPAGRSAGGHPVAPAQYRADGTGRHAAGSRQRSERGWPVPQRHPWPGCHHRHRR
ncbi:hypothetical protein G6F61_015006 [Rhizopus arrhizus]|nr:hypothetical protein G6F61_015006 [Rhizopus arrhizus]